MIKVIGDKNLTVSQQYMTTFLESKHNLRLYEIDSGTCTSVKSSSRTLKSSQILSGYCFQFWTSKLKERQGKKKKKKTWKGFRRDSRMINRMKNKTSKERWKELFAAFKRRWEVTIKIVLQRGWSSCSQTEENMQK